MSDTKVMNAGDVKVTNIRCKSYECLRYKNYKCLSCKSYKDILGTTSNTKKYYWTTADTGTRI